MSLDRLIGKIAASMGSYGMHRMNSCILGSWWPPFWVCFFGDETLGGGHFSFKPSHIPKFLLLFLNTESYYIVQVVMELTSPG